MIDWLSKVIKYESVNNKVNEFKEERFIRKPIENEELIKEINKIMRSC
jgi:hypothetical protein